MISYLGILLVSDAGRFCTHSEAGPDKSTMIVGPMHNFCFCHHSHFVHGPSGPWQRCLNKEVEYYPHTVSSCVLGYMGHKYLQIFCLVLVRVSITTIKLCDQKHQNRRNRFISVYNSTSCPITEESQERKLNGAGTWTLKLMQSHEECCLLVCNFLSLLPYNTQNYQPSMILPTVTWTLPYQTSVKKCCTGLFTGQSNGGSFLVEILSSKILQLVLSWQKKLTIMYPFGKTSKYPVSKCLSHPFSNHMPSNSPTIKPIYWLSFMNQCKITHLVNFPSR